MNHRCFIIAASALAVGVTTLGATQASARVPDDDRPGNAAIVPHVPPAPEFNYPEYDPQYEVAPVEVPTVHSSSDDNGVGALQASASALGGASVALVGMWLYRRRQTHVA
jgi:hypothetical protein